MTATAGWIVTNKVGSIYETKYEPVTTISAGSTDLQVPTAKAVWDTITAAVPTTATANYVFAGPTTGAAAAPTFRALVAADLGTTLAPTFASVQIDDHILDTADSLTFTLQSNHATRSCLQFKRQDGTALARVGAYGVDQPAFANASASKILIFGITGLTDATPRTATFPDASITVAGSASALTSGYIPVATTGGLLADSDLQYASGVITRSAGLQLPANVGIGTAVSTGRGVNYVASFTDASEAKYGVISQLTSTTVSASNSRAMTALYGSVDLVPATGQSITTTDGTPATIVNGAIYHKGAGTVDVMRGINIFVGNTTGCTGTTTDAIGLKIWCRRIAGAITTFKGIELVDSGSTATITNPWGFYENLGHASTKNYLAHALLIGTTTLSGTETFRNAGASVLGDISIGAADGVISRTSGFTWTTDTLSTYQTSTGVGIGIAPTVKFQTAGTSTVSTSILTGRFSANTSPAFMRMQKSRNASIGSHTVVVAGDSCGSLQFEGSDGAAYVACSAIIGGVEGTISSGNMPGNLQFYVTQTTTLAEAMRINSAKQVLIGTTAAVGSEIARFAGGSAATPTATDVTIGGGSVRAGAAVYGASANFGGATHYSAFETDGTLVFNGDATVWEDINIDLSPLQTGGTAPGFATIASTNIRLRSFAVNEDVDGAFEIPHSYKLSSNITAHIHFLCDSAPTGTDYVKWQLEYYIVDAGGTVSTSTTIDTGDVAVDTQWKRVDANFTLNITHATLGGQVAFKLKRIAAAGDAYAGECAVQTFGFHYEQDTVGSRQITTK